MAQISARLIGLRRKLSTTATCAVPCLLFAFMFWTVDLFRSDMLYFITWFGHVPVKESFNFLITRDALRGIPCLKTGSVSFFSW